LAEALPGVRNYQAAVHEENGRIVFLHRIVPGAADRSYGVHVAELAGLPVAVLERARQILARLENQHEANAAAARQTRRTRKTLADFGYSLFDCLPGEPSPAPSRSPTSEKSA
jgi:DNA mismatch repair protein MutS